MDPISIAMGLAQFAPQLIKWLSGSDKAADVAQKAIDIAETVTGKQGQEALEAIKADAGLQFQYRQAVLAQRVELEKLATEEVKAVNETMRAEAAAEHWPTYGWRPFIGFNFGAYLASMWLLPLFGKQPVTLSPDLTLAIGAILGVASWFRGKMQADPNVPTVNRG